MSLVEFHVELGRVADALDRIVFLLEKLVFPPLPADIKVQQATLDDLHIVSPEDHERMVQEQFAFAERFRVVPGSEAFTRELLDWEREQRNLHGEEWQAPDWAEAFATAARGSGSVRESPRAAGSAAEGPQG